MDCFNNYLYINGVFCILLTSGIILYILRIVDYKIAIETLHFHAELTPLLYSLGYQLIICPMQYACLVMISLLVHLLHQKNI